MFIPLPSKSRLQRVGVFGVPLCSPHLCRLCKVYAPCTLPLITFSRCVSVSLPLVPLFTPHPWRKLRNDLNQELLVKKFVKDKVNFLLVEKRKKNQTSTRIIHALLTQQRNHRTGYQWTISLENSKFQRYRRNRVRLPR